MTGNTAANKCNNFKHPFVISTYTKQNKADLESDVKLHFTLKLQGLKGVEGPPTARPVDLQAKPQVWPTVPRA